MPSHGDLGRRHNRESQRRLREQHRAEGTCLDCGRERRPGRLRCLWCLGATAIRWQRWYDRNKLRQERV